MIKIAYCDDTKKDRDNILYALTQIEEKLGEEFELYSFSSGESLCEDICKNHYDIILLDILMNGIDGIETAEKIVSTGEDCKIIFISNTDDRLRDMFGLNTIGFIDKPIDTQKLEKLILKGKKAIDGDKDRLFIYKSNRTNNFMPLKNIVYFQSRGKIIEMYCKKSMIEFTQTLGVVWEQLADSDEFVKISKSHIFNLNYVIVSKNQVKILETGEIFNVGRKYKELLQEKHLCYMERNVL